MSFTTPQEIAADIVSELTEHPELWAKYYRALDACSPETGFTLIHHISARAGANRILYLDTLRAYKNDLKEESLTFWNDDTTRTVADIIAVSQRVAGQS